jgi:hypothetical protein
MVANKNMLAKWCWVNFFVFAAPLALKRDVTPTN